jgi:hypothetical protein
MTLAIEVTPAGNMEPEIYRYHNEQQRNEGLQRLMAKAEAANDGVARDYCFGDLDCGDIDNAQLISRWTGQEWVESSSR